MSPNDIDAPAAAWNALVARNADVTLTAGEIDAMLSSLFQLQASVFRLSTALSKSGLFTSDIVETVKEANAAADISLNKAKEVYEQLKFGASKRETNG